MTSSAIPGPLSALHRLLVNLAQDIPDSHVNGQFHPQLGSAAWYLGRCVYQEPYWLREVIGGDPDLSRRVARLFVPGVMPPADQYTGPVATLSRH